MSINSSSKPHSVTNHLGGAGERFPLIFKSNASGKKITQDALYVCQLLAINPEDLIQRDLASFSEKGLSEKRQQLRYEHYEEKRILKLKAIQNVLVKCQQKDPSGDALQIQSLIEDLKKQKQQQSYMEKQTRANTSPKSYFPFKTQKLSYSSNDFMNSLIDPNTMMDSQQKKKQDLEERAQKILESEQKKFEQISVNQRERMFELQERLKSQSEKWVRRVSQRADTLRREEQKHYLRVKEAMKQQMLQIQQKMQKEEEEGMKNGKRRNFSKNYNNTQSKNTRNNNEESENDYNTSYYSQRKVTDYDDDQKDVDMELRKLEEKIKRAEQRNLLRKEAVIQRSQNHSLIINEKRQIIEQKEKQRIDDLINKTVSKAVRTQSKQDMIQQEMGRQAKKLQELHREKEKKLREVQDWERKEQRQQLQMLNRKINDKEQFLKQKREQQLDQILGKKEKRKLQFEDKAENERRLRLMQMEAKQQIFEKHFLKDKKLSEMKSQWNNGIVA